MMLDFFSSQLAGTLSRIIGVAAETPMPSVVLRPAIKAYSSWFNINMDEVSHPSEGYSCFGDFFARKLQADARPACLDKNSFVSPSDGKLVVIENISDDGTSRFCVKNYDYDIDQLIGKKSENIFNGGTGLVVYLHPRDYHRVHVPLNAVLTDVCHIPGCRYPVAPWSESKIKGLYGKNERMVFNFKIENEYLSLIMVAAFGVGNIASEYSPQINHSTSSFKKFDSPIELAASDELGTFRLGSTVVMLSSANLINLNSDLTLGTVIKGQKFGTVLVANDNNKLLETK